MVQTSFVVTSQDCEKFIFTETTGAYALDNLVGWGFPNSGVGDTLDSYVTISNTTTGIDYQNIEITPSENDSTDIIFADLILSTGNENIGTLKIIDGVYNFKYIVLLEDGEIVTSSFYFLSLCELECQIKSLTYAYINEDCKACNKNELKLLFLEVMALYKALVFSYQCLDLCSFNKIYTNITKLLKNYNCKTC
jgi:hypothetical protein